jgi:hypothetical protein
MLPTRVSVTHYGKPGPENAGKSRQGTRRRVLTLRLPYDSENESHFQQVSSGMGSMKDSADSNHVFAQNSQDGQEGCHTERVAQSELVAVDRCSCGTLSIHLGPMTLRVRPEGLGSIVETLRAALRADEQYATDTTDSRLVQAALSTALSQGKPKRGQS